MRNPETSEEFDPLTFDPKKKRTSAENAAIIDEAKKISDGFREEAASRGPGVTEADIAAEHFQEDGEEQIEWPEDD